MNKYFIFKLLIGGLSGVGGPSAPKNNNQLSKTEAALNTLKEAAKVIDTEIGGVSTKQAKGGVAEDDKSKLPQDMQEVGQEFASEINDQKVKEKKQKEVKERKKNLEQKMAELETLEGMLDEQSVEPESQGVIKEFFTNMSRLKNLRGRLKQLDQDERNYQEQLKQEKEQEKKEKERKKKKNTFLNKKEDEEDK